jgi:hypothetical protein
MNVLSQNETFFVTKVKINAKNDVYIRISQEAINVILDKLLGKNNKRFNLTEVSELEARIITAFNDFLYESLAPNFTIEPNRRYSEILHLTYFVKSEISDCAAKFIISVPKDIHKNKPYFFPARDTSFVLRLPDGEILSAKLCQSESKALMSNPNRALGFWILRKILKLPSKTIVTMEHLNKVGFDSIVVYKNKELDYSIDVCYSESFFDFVSKF